MKILTRYILREFSKPFFLSVLGFSVLVLIIQVFNDMKLILEHKPSLWITFKYFILQVPKLSIKAVPIAVLMAVLLSLSRLSKNNELIAMRAGGISIFLVVIPLFFSGVVICGLTIFFNEIVVPKTIKMVRHTKLVEINKENEPTANLYRENLSMIGSNGQIYHITSYDGSSNTMTDVLILQFDNDKRLKS
ncbi:MAG TPA: LptF/LptG family permease, partial [bacterium]